jgi:drug/metabolite transporter (DMT)-like permease
MKLLPLILIAIFTESLGGALLSRGMKQVGQVIDAGEVVLSSPIALDSLMSIYPPLAYYSGIGLLTVTNLNFLSGLLLQITFFLLFLTLLSKADLSYVLPVTSFSYVITATLAVFVLQENVSGGRWFGILLICLGVLLVGQGESRTTPTSNLAPNEEASVLDGPATVKSKDASQA